MLTKLQSLIFILSCIILVFLVSIIPVLAQDGEIVSPITKATSTAGFLLLLPLGLILFTTSSLPQAEQYGAGAATTAFIVWGLATLAYFGAGFAFQFGGVAVSNPHSDFAELYWNWSPLDASFGPGWGVIGLRGWALLGTAATPGVYDLFLRHIALLGITTTIPTFILYRRARFWVLMLFALLAGTLFYPLIGNWLWSGGWLANLGLTQNLGHGFVDAGFATPFLISGIICLAALLIFKQPKNTNSVNLADTSAEVPMPAAYLALLSFFGLGMVLWSWAFVANAQHIPTATNIAMPRAALNGFLGSFAGAVFAALYSKFTTTQFNPLMSARGGLAGLIIVSAAAPFIVPWQAIIAGAIAGLLLPFFIYFVDYTLNLNDHTGGVATYGVMGLFACLLVAFIADGSSGIGWNNVGMNSYLGVDGQGVSGVLVVIGYASDWPSQLNAQLLGVGAIIVWVFLLSGALFKFESWLVQRKQITVDSNTLTAFADKPLSETVESEGSDEVEDKKADTESENDE